MRAGCDIVRPEHQRHIRALDDAAEQRLGPDGMAKDTIEPPGFDDLGQATPGAENRLRTTRTRFRKAMHGHAGRGKLGAEAALEAQRHFRLDGRTERTQASHGFEQRFDAAVKVAAVDVQDAH